MRKFENFVFVLLSALLLVSCFGDEAEEAFDASSDAYIIKKYVGDEAVYGTVFYTYANQIMRSVSASEMGGSGEKINLTQDPGSLYTMSKKPQSSDFKPYPSAANEYLFEIVSESGVNKENYDFLSHDDIEIAEITKAGFNDIGKLLEIEWTAVEGADGFVVKIQNEEGINISVSPGFDPDILDYTINVVLEDWLIVPESGKTYTIQIHAFAYEPEYEEGYQFYNIQEVSIAETPIVWL